MGLCRAACILFLGVLAAVAQADDQDGTGPHKLTRQDLDELADKATIRDRAPTFQELVKTTGAVASWNNRDLLWVKLDDNRQPVSFAMDQAYEITSKKTAEWVTLKITDSVGPFVTGEEILYTRHRAVMNPRSNGAHARRLIADPNKGEVYELEWPSLMLDGTGHWRYERRIIVLQRAGQWRVLGEFEGNESGNEGLGDYREGKLEVKASWTKDGDVELSLLQQLTFIDLVPPLLPWETSRPEVIDHTQGIARQARADNKHMDAQWKDDWVFIPRDSDTVEKLAERWAWWKSSAWREDAGRLKRAQAICLAAILKANPGLNATTVVKKDTKVTVPPDKPMEKELTEQIPTSP